MESSGIADDVEALFHVLHRHSPAVLPWPDEPLTCGTALV